MTKWQRWLKAPQTLLLRRFLFQVHLWMGVGFGLYIFFISITGSAVVLRPEFNRWFVDSRVQPSDAGAFSEQQIAELVANVYSEYNIVNIVPSPYPSRAFYIALEKNGEELSHYFNQYTGEDQGSTYPWPVKLIEKLVSLHDDLWLGSLGRKINGVGGALLIIMLLTGMVIWWQGRLKWQQSLLITDKSTRSFNWQLHSFLGFWSFLLMFSWGLTALYFAFPAPFESIIDWLDSDLEDFERPDSWLLFLIKIHFGRFGGLWGRITWIILGFLPAIMFVTGFIVWWQRVLKKSV